MMMTDRQQTLSAGNSSHDHLGLMKVFMYNCKFQSVIMLVNEPMGDIVDYFESKQSSFFNIQVELNSYLNQKCSTTLQE
jgi:hypothetical protein